MRFARSQHRTNSVHVHTEEEQRDHSPTQIPGQLDLVYSRTACSDHTSADGMCARRDEVAAQPSG